MARIAGVEIPEEKRIEIALTYIHGIGRPMAQKILTEVNIDKNKRTKDLAEKEVAQIRSVIEKKYRVEGELRRITRLNIKRLEDIKCYRGIRHLKGLPVRGQRTRTNARTRKGKRITIGGLKRKLEKT